MEVCQESTYDRDPPRQLRVTPSTLQLVLIVPMINNRTHTRTFVNGKDRSTSFDGRSKQTPLILRYTGESLKTELPQV